MEMLIAGLQGAFSLYNLFLVICGISIGIVVGAIPGLNGPMALAVAVPLTFTMDPIGAIALLMGVSKGAAYGGGISAILLNVPGTADAVTTTFDGYPLARQGKSQKALKMALYASASSDFVSDILLILLAAPFAVLALRMGPSENTALLFFSLTFISALLGDSMLKGLMAAGLGLLLSTVGFDTESDTPRMTFGVSDLEAGVPLLTLIIGLLALSEILVQLEGKLRFRHSDASQRESILPSSDNPLDRKVTWPEFRSCIKTILRSTAIGSFIGALPGLGSTLAGFIGYSAAKKNSKRPEAFGKGELEGVAAAEAAVGAVNGANLIPTLVLGIPGNLSAAVLLGAFMIHGLQPGPLIFVQNGATIYAIFGAMLIANIVLLGVGHVGLRIFSYVVTLPGVYVYPSIVLFCFAGAYIDTSSMFGLGLLIAFGILGYGMRKLGLPVVALVIAFIMGPLVENSLRQTIVLFGNSPLRLLEHPVTVVFGLLTVVALWRIARGARFKVKSPVEQSG